MRVLDLFSGIGGFSLGLERAGFTTVAFCEIAAYPRRVLSKHWPDVPIYEDVRELTDARLRQDGITVDVICGGFPCQDISCAGQQAGIGPGSRSGLWTECARLLGEIRPQYAIFENVTALLSGDNGDWFKRVLWDISAIGYDAEWHCIPATALGAPHGRDRVWIICYPNKDSESFCTVNAEASGRSQDPGRNQLSDPKPHVHESKWRMARAWGQRQSAARHDIWNLENCPIGLGMADGIPDRMDRLRGLGNAVIPQIVETIGAALQQEGEG